MKSRIAKTILMTLSLILMSLIAFGRLVSAPTEETSLLAQAPGAVRKTFERAVLRFFRGMRRGLIGRDIAVGMGSLQGAELRQGLKDGTLGAIWPEEGAMAFPYLMAVRKNPNKADLALFNLKLAA